MREPSASAKGQGEEKRQGRGGGMPGSKAKKPLGPRAGRERGTKGMAAAASGQRVRGGPAARSHIVFLYWEPT